MQTAARLEPEVSMASPACCTACAALYMNPALLGRAYQPILHNRLGGEPAKRAQKLHGMPQERGASSFTAAWRKLLRRRATSMQPATLVSLPRGSAGGTLCGLEMRLACPRSGAVPCRTACNAPPGLPCAITRILHCMFHGVASDGCNSPQRSSARARAEPCLQGFVRWRLIGKGSACAYALEFCKRGAFPAQHLKELSE